jgi:hypothetical protein
MLTKYVKSQKTGEYVPIEEGDMDYNTKFAKTLEELIVERDAINKIVYGTERFKT